jgi:carbon storage regulator CsrA
MKRTQTRVAALPHDAPEIPEQTQEHLLPEKPEGYSRLVLNRKPGESLVINCNGVQMTVALVQINNKHARVAIVAPKDVHIRRTELEENAYGRR